MLDIHSGPVSWPKRGVPLGRLTPSYAQAQSPYLALLRKAIVVDFFQVHVSGIAESRISGVLLPLKFTFRCIWVPLLKSLAKSSTPPVRTSDDILDALD